MTLGTELVDARRVRFAVGRVLEPVALVDRFARVDPTELTLKAQRTVSSPEAPVALARDSHAEVWLAERDIRVRKKLARMYYRKPLQSAYVQRSMCQIADWVVLAETSGASGATRSQSLSLRGNAQPVS